MVTPVASEVRAPATDRLLSLDLMRGYCVLVLVAVHLNYIPSLLGYFDGRGVLWLSEAEGFFFISGMLVAMIGRRNLERGGILLTTKKAWRRAGQLYLLAIGLTLLYTAIGRWATDQGWSGVKVGLDEQSSWLDIAFRTLTLRYVYGWADFLTFYVPLFLVAPLIVWALSRRLDALVLGASFGAYASLTWFSWGAFEPFMQWQGVFVLGSVIGFHFSAIRQWWEAQARRTRLWIGVSAVVLTFAIYAAGMIVLYTADRKNMPELYDMLLANNRLGLLRPLICLVTFVGIFVALEYLRKPVMSTIGRPLELFGKNSLYVYIVGSAIVFAVPFIFRPQNFWINTAFDLAVIALIWLALRKRFLTRFVPR